MLGRASFAHSTHEIALMCVLVLFFFMCFRVFIFEQKAVRVNFSVVFV